MELSRAANLPGFTRHPRTLQTNHFWGSLGYLTAIVYYDCIQYFLREPGKNPYPLFSYCALVPWMYFANSLAQSTSSLVEHERIITKVYFPRLLLPMAPVLAGFLDFAISFSVLVGMLFFYGYKPTSSILTIPFFILLAAMTSLGAGLWLSALNVRFRDVRYVTPFLIQFWLFITPIAYPSSLLPEKWRVLYALNPVAGVIEGFRWALLGDRQVPVQLIFVSSAAMLVLLVSGLFFFRWMEKTFADVL
jgi:lipopolysaccharide transport system permease protein